MVRSTTDVRKQCVRNRKLRFWEVSFAKWKTSVCQNFVKVIQINENPDKLHRPSKNEIGVSCLLLSRTGFFLLFNLSSSYHPICKHYQY